MLLNFKLSQSEKKKNNNLPFIIHGISNITIFAEKKRKIWIPMLGISLRASTEIMFM